MGSIKSIISRIGGAELAVVSYPVLVQYPNHIGLTVIVLTAIYLLAKKGKTYWYKPLLLYLVYMIIHEILIGMIVPFVPMYFINRTIVSALSIVLIFVIAPNIDYEKFYYSLLLVAIICLIGLLYHIFVITFSFGTVSAIQLPLLPKIGRAGEELVRPCSFFVEPASYAAFMTIIVAFCIIRRKMLWAIVFSISMLLSTSTNGFAFVLVIWSVFLLLSNKSNEKNIKRNVVWVVVLIGAFFWLASRGAFDMGFEKIAMTDSNDDVRLTSGLNLYRNIPFEYKIFGINTVNVYEFIMQHAETLVGNFRILIKENEVYLPSFWENAIHFGLPGVCLYIFCFLGFVREKSLWPFIAVCLVSSFSQSSDLFIRMVFLMVVFLHFKDNKSYIEEKKS